MWFLKILGAYVALMVVMGVLAYAGLADFAGTVMAIAVLMFVPVVIIAAGVHLRKNREKYQEKAERARLEAEQNRVELAEARRIVEVKLLGGGTTNYKRNGLGGAVVGAMVAGPVGALIGGTASSGKGKQKQKFAVKYGDGSVSIVECDRRSRRYKELMGYVKWEEL